MKLQNLAVIFAIIIIPLSLLLSMYIQYQIDSLALQTSYDVKLLAATHDAVSAFQSNSLNSTRESYEFSTKRHVLAAAKTFSNSLASSLNISGYGSEELDPYIPALLFTMYDGYYIYTPQETTEQVTDSNGNITEETTYKHDLKSYVYYSMRYNNERIDVVINYSLDNYITVCGYIDDQYVSRSGYLRTGNDSVEGETLREDIKILDGDLDYDGELSTDEFKGLCSNYGYLYINTDVWPIYQNLSQNGGVTAEQEKIIRENYKYSIISCTYRYDENSDKIYKSDVGKYYKYDKDGKIMELTDRGDKLDYSARAYYVESADFTRWIYDKLGSLTVDDMCTIQGTKAKDAAEGYSDFNFGDPTEIFKISGTNNPEDDTSAFSQHKRKVMRFLIENDLSSSIAAYNERLGGKEYDYRMPKITEEEWDKILKNVALVSFLEGIPAGNKIYNNYAIVTSTMNTKYVDEDTLYYVDASGVYHLKGCLRVNMTQPLVAYKKSDFYRYTYYNSTYQYMKHNERACYYCVVGRTREATNYTSPTQESDLNTLYNAAYLKAIGRERYNLYKSTEQLNLSEDLPE